MSRGCEYALKLKRKKERILRRGHIFAGDAKLLSNCLRPRAPVHVGGQRREKECEKKHCLLDFFLYATIALLT